MDIEFSLHSLFLYIFVFKICGKSHSNTPYYSSRLQTAWMEGFLKRYRDVSITAKIAGHWMWSQYPKTTSDRLEIGVGGQAYIRGSRS